MCEHCNHHHNCNGENNNELSLLLRDNGKCVMCGHYDDVEKYNGINICKNCKGKFYNELKYAKDLKGIEKLSNGTEMLLDGLKDLYGIDPDDDNFKDTKYRVARLFMEIAYGTNIQATKDLLQVTFDSSNNYNGLISCNNIKVFSFCPHHLLPVEYEISVAYVPTEGRCLGLSKLPRLCKTLARSLILQEDLTNKIADMLDSVLKPAGVAVQLKGVHNCVQCRGIGMPDVRTTTITLRGIMLANPSLKEEWLHTIQNSNN